LSLVGDFIDVASSLECREGTRRAVREIAARRFPESLGLGRTELLQGDVHVLWVDWFLESVADPALGSADYATCYAHALTVLGEVLSTTPAAEREQAAKAVADALRKYTLARNERPRVALDTRQREWLLLEAGSPTRCWVCGMRFDGRTIDAFRAGTGAPTAQLPDYVDYFAPRGMRPRELRIEVDHVVPFSRGGADEPGNMRLACGWCNVAKANRLSLYEAGTRPSAIRHPRVGAVSVPLPYWVVRVLQSTEGRCETAGCTASADTHEMRVAVRFSGAPTPPNLSVVCAEHDPLAGERLVPRGVFSA
jgi:HNH endonuclease